MILSKVYEDAERRLEQNEITLGEFERLVDIEVVELKRGEWVNALDGVSDHVKCTNCFRTYYLGIVETYNFCPNCGARMKGADDE